MSMNLYVGNLPFTTTTEDLEKLFAEHGKVTRAQVMMDRETGRSRGFGFVEMSEGAEAAIQALNGAQFQGRTLTVNEAKPRESRRAVAAVVGGAVVAAAVVAAAMAAVVAADAVTTVARANQLAQIH
jgi:RNA recognition motif-containing protein